MQRAELALRLKEAVAAEAKKRQKEHGHTAPGKAKTLPPKLAEVKTETRDELARVAGVSHGTLAKVEKIVTQAVPAVVEAARKGEALLDATPCSRGAARRSHKIVEAGNAATVRQCGAANDGQGHGETDAANGADTCGTSSRSRAAARARTLQGLAARETPRKCAARHGQSLDGAPTFTATATG